MVLLLYTTDTSLHNYIFARFKANVKLYLCAIPQILGY